MIPCKQAGYTPLGERLARVEEGMPSDERYGEYVTNALTQLLAAPLEELFEQDPSALYDMTGYLARARALLKWEDDPRRDAEDSVVIHVLKTLYFLSLHGSPESISLKRRISLSLAHQLVRPPVAPPRERGAVIPLRERFDSVAASGGKELDQLLKKAPRRASTWDSIICQHIRAKEFPILRMPLSHYLYAASKVLGSDHPLRFYRENYDLDITQLGRSLAYMVKWGLGELPGMDPSNVTRLYDLLVEPLFPSADQAV